MKDIEEIKNDLKSIMEDMYNDAHRKRCGYYDYESFEDLYNDYKQEIDNLFNEEK